MPLDIKLFRVHQGGDLDVLRESCRRRYKDPAVIDTVVKLDEEWRVSVGKLDKLNKEARQCSKDVGQIMKSAKKAKRKPTEEELAKVKDLKARKAAVGKEQDEVKQLVERLEHERDSTLNGIGNLVHESVPVSNDEENNAVVRRWGTKRIMTGRERSHDELLWMIGGFEPGRGVKVAGHRAYFLTGPGVLLNMALQNFGMGFLYGKKAYEPVYPPFLMNKDVMARTAQLEDFDESLYHVSGESGDCSKYLIATSEQPISAMYYKGWMTPEQLPKRFAGVSTCFRKEAGSHGRDTWGVFRVHQFEKVEQFIYCAPEDSWLLHEEMIATAEEFYQALGIPFEIVTIVSGELNNAAAKKYDLEGWFPFSANYRELVSASNCTDYQSRGMETRFGYPKTGDREKAYVHMLNCTLVATTRTLSCILENYQTDDGVHVPEALQPYMHGLKFLPFVRPPPDKKQTCESWDDTLSMAKPNNHSETSQCAKEPLLKGSVSCGFEFDKCFDSTVNCWNIDWLHRYRKSATPLATQSIFNLTQVNRRWPRRSSNASLLSPLIRLFQSGLKRLSLV